MGTMSLFVTLRRMGWRWNTSTLKDEASVFFLQHFSSACQRRACSASQHYHTLHWPWQIASITPCIMARLSDLPAETILHIAFYLQPSEPPTLQLFDDDYEYDESDDQQYSDFEPEREIVLPDPAESIRSFAQVDRKCYEILSAEARRHITISGSEVPQKVVSLLRLTSENPLTRNAVQRLALLLDAGTYDVQRVTDDDVPLLRSMASEKQMPGVILNTTETLENGTIGGQRVCAFQDLNGSRRPSRAVLQFAPEVLLLLNLPRLEDLALCISAGQMHEVRDIFRKGPLKLLALKSLTLKGLACGFPPRPGDYEMEPGVVENLLKFAPQVTDLFVRDLELRKGLYPKSLRARGLRPESLTTLGLHSIGLDDRQLEETMAACKNLTKFAYRNRHPPMYPEDVAKALSVRADTLRTIWLDMASSDHEWFECPDREGVIMSLGQFRKLENLWIDVGSFAPESRFNPEGGMEHLLDPRDRADTEEVREYEYPHLAHLWGNPLVRTLPASLKRFHVWESSLGYFNNDLKWLVKQRMAGTMPQLEEIGVDEIDAAGLKAMPKFARSGVSVCEAAPCPKDFLSG